MATKSIEERANDLYNDIAYSVNCGNDICFHPQCDGKQEAIDALIEQDRIARKEERERCIKLAQEWRCKNECIWFKNHGSCPIGHPCDTIADIRKALEKGGKL